jgi:hypothetical protein
MVQPVCFVCHSRPVLTTSINSDYEITLLAAYENKIASDVVHIKIDNSISDVSLPPDPKIITFDGNIRAIFSPHQDPANSSETDPNACQDCHQDATGIGAVVGIPVHWRDTQPASGDNATNGFYKEVLSRVDFNDPENSLFLTGEYETHVSILSVIKVQLDVFKKKTG